MTKREMLKASSRAIDEIKKYMDSDCYLDGPSNEACDLAISALKRYAEVYGDLEQSKGKGRKGRCAGKGLPIKTF